MSPCMPHQIRFQRSIFLTKLLKWRFIILKLIHSQIYFLLYQLLVIDNIFFCLKLQRRDAAVVLAAHVSGNRNVLNFWLSKSLPKLSDVMIIFVMIVLCQNDLCHEYHCQNIFCHLWNNQLPAMNWSNDERLLDIGCGSGDVTRFMFIILISILVTRLSLILILLILIYQYWYWYCIHVNNVDINILM